MEEYTVPEFSLTPILNEETKEYSLLHFDEVALACDEFIKANSLESVSNDDELKILKKGRTAIRKKKEIIKNTRISLTKLFSWQFLELEKKLGEADNDLKLKKDEYEASKLGEKVIEEKPIENAPKESTKLIIVHEDVNVIENIKKIAIESGCKVTEIKE